MRFWPWSTGTADGNRRPRQLGYEAVESSPRRRTPSSILRSEDDELAPSQRGKLLSTSRDLRRNFSLARWAIKKHLDYVASFEFQARTADKMLNARIEELMTWWSSPRRCDASGRHSLRRFTRLVEALATIDGDVLVIKLADGRLQMIEGDRIRTPREGVPVAAGMKVIHGVMVDEAGAARGYCVHRRGTGPNAFHFERIVPAENAILHGHFDRYEQTRGIGLLASGLNDFRDTAEAKEYALSKAKIAQLFGVKWKRDTSDDLPKSAEDSEDGTTVDEGKLDFGKGNWFFDLGLEEDVDLVESAHPSSQFQDFMKFSILLGLKTLDMPYSMFAENFTNFSGSRLAMTEYLQSVEDPRDQVRDVLAEIIAWKLATWVAVGLLVLPAGMTVWDLRTEWIATGNPGWIDPKGETDADALAVDRGFESTPAITKRRTGRDAFEVAEEEAAYRKRRAELELPEVGGKPSPSPAAPPASENPEEKPEEEPDESEEVPANDNQ